MKRRFPWSVLAVAMAGIAGWLWMNPGDVKEAALPTANATKSTPPPALPAKKELPAISFDPRPPRRIDIPSINVSANVTPVGKERSGAMEAPADNATVGWYKTGFLPGAQGNAVFAGHYGDSIEAGVFRSIGKLKPHDVIHVTTATRSLRFEVHHKKVYAHDAGRRKELFGKSDFAQLQLITCEGDWDEARASYTNRLVVTARFVSEKKL